MPPPASLEASLDAPTDVMPIAVQSLPQTRPKKNGMRGAPGDVIGQRYAVRHVIGDGVNGLLVSAEHLFLQRRFTLKVLYRHMLVEEVSLVCTLRGASQTAAARSPHIARVLDIDLSHEVPYIVMEPLEGQSLGSVLRSHGKLPVPVAIEVGLQLCDAIGDAHRRGVVHGALTLKSLFLTREGRGTPFVKVIDLDLAAFRERRRARADVRAVAAILYELLTGRPPGDPPRAISTIRCDVPREVDDAVLAALDERARSGPRELDVDDLARALGPAAPRPPSSPASGVRSR